MRGTEEGVEPQRWKRYEQPSSVSVCQWIPSWGDLESLYCAEGAWQARWVLDPGGGRLALLSCKVVPDSERMGLWRIVKVVGVMGMDVGIEIVLAHAVF